MPPNPKELIQAVDENYSACQTYADEGYVLVRSGESIALLICFRTYFKRPELLRIDWTPPRQRPDATTYEWSAIYNKKGEMLSEGRSLNIGMPGGPPYLETMDHLIAASSGVTFGLSIIAPLILMPDLTTRKSATKFADYSVETAPSKSTNLEQALVCEDNSIRFHLFLDDANFIREARMRCTTDKPGESLESNFVYRRVELNPEIPDDIFQL